MRTKPWKGIVVATAFIIVLAVLSTMIQQKEVDSALVPQEEDNTTYVPESEPENDFLWEALARQFTGSVSLK